MLVRAHSISLSSSGARKLFNSSCPAILSEVVPGEIEDLAFALNDPGLSELFVLLKDLDNLRLVLFEFRHEVGGQSPGRSVVQTVLCLGTPQGHTLLVDLAQ